MNAEQATEALLHAVGRDPRDYPADLQLGSRFLGSVPPIWNVGPGTTPSPAAAPRWRPSATS